MTDPIRQRPADLQRELDEAKASITVTYWHLFQTTETLLKEVTRLSSRNTQLMAENERQRVLLAALKREPATPSAAEKTPAICLPGPSSSTMPASPGSATMAAFGPPPNSTPQRPTTT